MIELDKTIGLIAGDGELPVSLVKSAREKGHEVISVALAHDNRKELSTLCRKINYFGPGQVGKILSFFQEQGVKQVCFIGKVSKTMLLRNPRLDSKALELMKQATRLNDDAVMLSLVNFIESHDIKVIDQTIFLREYFPHKTVLGEYSPTESQQADIEYGFQIAKSIGGLDLGQTVVVQDKMALAVEAIEGTDRAIKRGCQLGNKNAVVVKVSKPNQDKRFDVPAVGMRTLQNIRRYGGKVLAVEAGETFVLEKEKMVKYANRHKMVFVAV